MTVSFPTSSVSVFLACFTVAATGDERLVIGILLAEVEGNDAEKGRLGCCVSSGHLRFPSFSR